MSSYVSPEKAPRAPKIPKRFENHGHLRIDDYFWLREKENPDVIALLKAENAYTDHVLAPVKELREKLFLEMKARIQEDDADVPYKYGNYFYYTRMLPGKQYSLKCRKHLSLEAPEEVVLDCNALAEGQKYFSLGAYEVSPSQDILAYAVDLDGSEKYTILFKDLKTGATLADRIPLAHGSVEWANDNRTIFYNLLDQNERPDRVLRHTLGEEPARDTLIYKEDDTQIFVYVSKTRSERYLFIELHGKVTSEIRYLDADQPRGEFQMMEPRRRGVLYSADHSGDAFYIVTNDDVQNFRLVQAPVTEPGSANWREISRGSSELFIEDVSAFRSYLVLSERANGLSQLRVIELPAGPLPKSQHVIEFPDPTYSIDGQVNAEFDTTLFRFSYTSPVTPATVYDYDLQTRTREVKKTQKIPSGYDAKLYRSERVFAVAPDGVQVPISLVYKLDADGGFARDGSRPLYLGGYGSYGLTIDARFSTVKLSLLNRGFVVAHAHIRGGSDMGRQWYDDGKFLKKKNTFSDFIACAEHLTSEKYARPGEIAIVGGSAGGMLIGNVINQRPELFKAAVAHVPFVDVINTMLDASLPLTTTEYEEWGNPEDPVYYEYMKSYSPYDNVRAQNYPNLLVTSGLNDPRVTYWEPAKWVAKLRELKTDDRLLLQHINMEAGHGGPSGRYEALKQYALEYAFLLMVFGLTDRA